MNKKEYNAPTIRVIELDCTDIIATSGGSNSRNEEVGINDETPHRGPWD